MLVDLSLNGSGSQLVALILPMCKKDQGTLLYDAVSSYSSRYSFALNISLQIKKHVVTLKGSKAGSRITWLLCVPLCRFSELATNLTFWTLLFKRQNACLLWLLKLYQTSNFIISHLFTRFPAYNLIQMHH